MQLPMPPIKEPKFYADEYRIRDCFVETLEAFGMKMIRLEIKFEKGAADEVWMKKTAKWAIIH